MSTAATEWQIQTVWTDDRGFEHMVNYPPEKAYNLQRSLTRQGREWTSCSMEIYPDGTIVIGPAEFHNA